MRLARAILPPVFGVFFLFLFLFLCLAAPAAAQERGDNGITMGFPLSFGFVTHVSDRVALRPELQLSFSSAETDSVFQASSVESSVLGLGVSALIYIGDTDKLRTYVAPRYVFGRSNISSQTSFGDTTEQTIRSHTLIGSFGAQYALDERFSVFGEVGFGVTVDRRKSNISSINTDTTSASTRTGVGVVFYF